MINLFIYCLLIFNVVMRLVYFPLVELSSVRCVVMGSECHMISHTTYTQSFWNLLEYCVKFRESFISILLATPRICENAN